MMLQWRFIDLNKYTILVGRVDRGQGEGWAWAEAEGVQEIPVPSLSFAVDL